MASKNGGRTLSVKEADRLAVIQRVMAKELTQSEGAAVLRVSVRQIKRLVKVVRAQGAAGLISKHRGRVSNHRIAAPERTRVLALVRERYADFGAVLAHEYLKRDHGFEASAQTLRTWMIEDGLWTPSRQRAKRVHSPRPRRACLGELVQIDGSHHDWFEGRSTRCCLIAFIDDASGRVLGARWSPSETTQAYFDVLCACVQRHGAPLALYSDRHAIFTKHDPQDPVPTQFERALLQLDIEPIQAHSPQAKGRVERLFQTLQDRLCKALRLAHINDLNAANLWLDAYLARHNEQFAVCPRDSLDAHRPYRDTPEALQRICALHHQRQLNAHLSCQFENQFLQIHPHQDHLPKGPAQVDIVDYGNGHLEVLYRGHVLNHICHAWHAHLGKSRTHDAKTVNDAVDLLAQKAQKQIAKTMAKIELENAQRAMATQGTLDAGHVTPIPKSRPARPKPGRA
jgi:transposase InsO family protein